MNSTSLRQLFGFRTLLRRLLFGAIVVGGLLSLGTQALAQKQSSQPDDALAQSEQAVYVTVKDWFEQLTQDRPDVRPVSADTSPETPPLAEQTFFDSITALTDELVQLIK